MGVIFYKAIMLELSNFAKCTVTLVSVLMNMETTWVTHHPTRDRNTISAMTVRTNFVVMDTLIVVVV